MTPVPPHVPLRPSEAWGDLDAIAAIDRHFQITLTFPNRGEPAESVKSVARATTGRVNYLVRTPADSEFVAEHLL